MLIRCMCCKEVIPGDWPPYVAGICTKCRAEAYFTASREALRWREMMDLPYEPSDELVH